VKANLNRAAIVLTTCLFALPCSADETANAANGAAIRTVAAADSTGVKQRGNAVGGTATTRVATAVASEPRAQREPPAGVEVVRVYSARDDGTADETKEGSF